MTDNINIPVGHIFQEAKVLGRDKDYNLWVLKNPLQKNKLLLKDCYIPAGMSVKRGKMLVNLVLIRYGKKVLHVAVANYHQVLISHYYRCPNACYKPRKESWRIWSSRWQKEYGEDFNKNITIDNHAGKINDDLYNDVFWLRGSDYILPVFGYKDLDKLQGEPFFYPELFTDNYLIGRSVYKTDGFDALPQEYMAKINGKGLTGGMPKEVLIFFHGFTYPAKWHYGIWKHVLALTRTARESEKILWEKLWDANFHVSNNLFKLCKEVENRKHEEVACDENTCLSLALFKKVHTELNNICRKYLEQFVTSFEVNTTNNIVLFKGPFNSVKIVLTYIKQWTNIYQKTVLYGTCYNWDDTKPVFHINPVTMFLNDKFDKDWLSKNIVGDEDKRSRNIIFDGNLSEIKKCRQI